MVVRTFLVVVLAVIVLGLSEIDAASEDVCGCEAVEIVTTTDVVLRKHGQLLGRYHKTSRQQFTRFKGTSYLTLAKNF